MSISDYIIESTGLDRERESPLLFPGNRWDHLPRLLNWAGFKVGAEVGVGGGRFSQRLCDTVPGLKLYCVDPWESYGEYVGRVDQSEMDRSYRKTLDKLAGRNCEIIREYSTVAVLRFEAQSLDFVYIDANRSFENVTQDLTAWMPKVRMGGIVAGPCYYNFRNRWICRVKDAVDTFTVENNINPWFVIVHQRYPTWLFERRHEGTA